MSFDESKFYHVSKDLGDGRVFNGLFPGKFMNGLQMMEDELIKRALYPRQSTTSSIIDPNTGEPVKHDDPRN